MKRPLIAAAALLAAACAAAQQQPASSVTIYGAMDAGLARIRSGSPRAKYPGVRPAGNNASDKWQFASASLMNNAYSRFGLRGQEALGQGRAAGFNVESGLDLSDGASVGGAFWARSAYVWLGGDWGTVRLGRQLTPSNAALYAFEVTGDACYGALSNTYGYAGMSVRMNSAITYITPSMGGWQAAVAVASKNNTGSRGDVWDVGLTYAGTQLAAGIALNQGADGAGRLNWMAGARYALGGSGLSLAASYTRRQLDGSNIRREGMSLGALLRANALQVALDVVHDRKNEIPAHAGKKHTNAVLEGRYHLSRRTFLYAAALRLDGDRNWGVGMRHNF